MLRGERRAKIILIIVIILLVIIAGLVWYLFFHTKTCSNYECFNNAALTCSRASYLNEAQEATWQYKILGEKNKYCMINVKLLMIKEGKSDSGSLEGKDMDCYLSNGEIQRQIQTGIGVNPNYDLKGCHGILREDMQDIIIKNLWAVVIQNIGKVKEELLNPF